MKYVFSLLFLVLTNIFWSQNVDLLFSDANRAYKDADYLKALKYYKQIDSSGMRSADLYFNMGNAYYKLNEVAPSIYYYEKSLLLDPNHQDARQNLTFAKRMSVDVFEEIPKTLLQKIDQAVIYAYSYNTWAWISVLLSFLFALLFLGYYFSYNSLHKRLFFIFGFIFVFLYLVTLSFTFKAKHHYTKNQPAIIFSQKVEVSAEPGNHTVDSFTLHEGTKVQVIDRLDSWYKIKLPDGNVGWLARESVKKIK